METPKTKTESVYLMLGDIIKLISPTNETYHEKMYSVDYIDNKEYIKIVNDTQEEILTLDSSGKLNDTSVTKIILLKRNDIRGYAKQHGLISDTWINLYFDGDYPTIITGIITNLEEDMIEVKLQDDTYIYIDFAYKGIPPTHGIERIEIRDAPHDTDTPKLKQTSVELPRIVDEDVVTDADADADEGDGDEDGPIVENESTGEAISIDMSADHDSHEPDDYQREVILTDSNIVDIGDEDSDDDLGEIEQFVKVTDDELRYGIHIQLDDLTNAMISKDGKDNMETRKKIEKIVARYTTLRDEFSKKDHNDYPGGPLFLGIDHKPLAQSLESNNMPMPWIIPTISEKHKIYDISVDPDDYPDTQYTSFDDERTFENEQLDNYKTYGNQMYYDKYLSTFTPYIPVEDFTTFHTNKALDTISHNYKNVKSTHLSAGDISVDNHVVSRILPEDEGIHYNGFICLFTYWLNASRSYLPATSLIDKAELIKGSFHDYSRVYKNSRLKTHTYSVDRNLDFKYDDMFHVTYDSTDSSISWRDFLHKVLPTNRHLISKYTDNMMKLTSPIGFQYMVQCLEAFMLTPSTIVFEDLDILVKKIYEKRKLFYTSYNANVRLNKSMYDTLTRMALKQHYGFQASNQHILENYFPGKSKEEKELLIEFIHTSYYSKGEITFITPHERLLYYTTQDSGDCFASILGYANIHLLNPDIEALLQKYQEVNASKGDGKSKSSDNQSICKTSFILAKKYTEMEDLIEDNGSVIYFDKQYDKTYYTAKDIYSSEKNKMSAEQFTSFLEKKMMEVHQLSHDASKSMVTTIMNGKKKVENGHFCLLETIPDDYNIQNTFYKRINDEWKEDKEASKIYSDNYSLSLKNSVCTTNLPCFDPTDYSDICEDSGDRRKQLQSKLIDDMMNEYKHIHSKTKGEYKLIVEECEFYLARRRKVNEKKRFIYSIYHNELAAEYDATTQPDKSPHLATRDSVLGIRDFAEKQEKLRIFIHNYCRKPFKEIKEDPYWLYCKETQTPLLPMFLETLNQTYIKGENYVYMLEIICQQQGALSDDESAWVDDESGFVIRYVDLYTDEGYDTSGRKAQTRDVLEIEDEPISDIIEVIEETIVHNDYAHEYKDAAEKSDVDVNNTTTMDAVEEDLYIGDKSSMADLPDDDDVMLIQSTYSNPDIQFIDTLFYIMENKMGIVSKPEIKHNLLVKTLQFYDKHRSTSSDNTYKLVLMFLSTFVVYLQLRINEISYMDKHKTCKPFLQGFPVFDIENMDTIKYVVCLAKDYKISAAILKPSSATLSKDVMDVLVRLASNEFAPIIQDYLRNEVLSKQTQIGQYQWLDFSPPLFNFTIKRLQPLQKNGESNAEYINNVGSKILLYSYALIEKIQTTTSKQAHLLTTSDQTPYLENTCCLHTKNPIEFFIKENKDIGPAIKYLADLYDIYDGIRTNSHTKMMSFSENTKIMFPDVDPGFSENILHKIKTTIENNGDSDILDANILLTLNNVYKKNIIKVKGLNIIQTYKPVIDYITRFNDINKSEEQTHVPDITSHFLTLNTMYGNMIVNYNDNDFTKVTDQEILDFKSFLFTTMKPKYDNIVKWLNLKKSKTAKKQPVYDIINFIYSFHETSMDYDSMIRFTQLIKSFLYYFITLIPNMILNKYNQKMVKIPKHWELAPSHIMDLQSYMQIFYSRFSRFIDNSNIEDHMRKYILHIQDYYIMISQLKTMPMATNFATNSLIYANVFFTIVDEFITFSSSVKKPTLVSYISTMMETFYHQKSTAFMEYESVMKNILRSKQDEKDKIVKKLKEKTKEERAVINEMKKHKLGEWGRGLQKGLVQYDVNVFADERNLFLEDEMRETNDLSGYDEEYNHVDNE
uniref:Uncharacterized protein n=1 Tax=viral metagenome TaxID=1070528 RepID=A0A6C0LTK7_9ZZZZ